MSGYVSLCVSMCVDRCRCRSIAVDVFFIGDYRPLYTAIYRYIPLYTAVYGYVPVCIGMYGRVRICTDMYGWYGPISANMIPYGEILFKPIQTWSDPIWPNLNFLFNFTFFSHFFLTVSIENQSKSSEILHNIPYTGPYGPDDFGSFRNEDVILIVKHSRA